MSAWQQFLAAGIGILTTALVALAPKAIKAAGDWLDYVGANKGRPIPDGTVRRPDGTPEMKPEWPSKPEAK